MEQEIQLNEHNKQEYPPMHTAEHILNQTMVRMFGCPRSKNAHIERKKSKCDYELQEEPTAEMMEEVERRINGICRLQSNLCRKRKPERSSISASCRKTQARHCALSASETMTLARVSEHMSITRQKSDISKCSHTITPTDGYACVSN